MLKDAERPLGGSRDAFQGEREMVTCPRCGGSGCVKGRAKKRENPNRQPNSVFDCGGRKMGISEAVGWWAAMHPGATELEIIAGLSPLTDARARQVAVGVNEAMRTHRFYRIKRFTVDDAGRFWPLPAPPVQPEGTE